MAMVKLTQTAWYDREYPKVKAILTHRLEREPGIDESTLARLLKRYLATDYTGPELAAFRDQLVTDGVIEIVP